MAIFSAGFTGRHKRDAKGADLPPGQYVTHDFPVLSAGPTPQVPLDAWRLEVGGEAGVVQSWTWDEFRALDAEKVTVDVHCVTRWSKLGTAAATCRWRSAGCTQPGKAGVAVPVLRWRLAPAGRRRRARLAGHDRPCVPAHIDRAAG